MLHLDPQALAEGVDPAEPVLDTGEEDDAPPLLHQVLPGHGETPLLRLPDHGVHVGQDPVHPVPAAEVVGDGPELRGLHPQGGDEGIVLHVRGAEGLVEIVEEGDDGGGHGETSFVGRVAGSGALFAKRGGRGRLFGVKV